MTTQLLETSLTISCELVPKLNFACHQNAFGFLRELHLENTSETLPLDNVTVTLTSNPEFLTPRSWHFDRISPGSGTRVQDKEITLDGAFLLGLTDSIRGTVTLVAECDGVTLAETHIPVELLAYNEWGGTAYIPELLAAFVTPNDPGVDRILKDACRILQKAGKNTGMNGYQSGSRQEVWQMVSAIYSAIANLRLNYASHPASFEYNGQKVRMPAKVLESGLATCLDSTLLFAAAFEQAGLNPVIVMPESHAFIGVWLQPEQFPTIVIDEASEVRKRVQANELLILETTLVTAYPAPPFTGAQKAALDKISPDDDDTFVSAIDIKQARSRQIKPLGIGLAMDSAALQRQEEEVFAEHALEQAPLLPDFEIEAQEKAAETPADRLERWQRKLLDLTLLNRLLNHRAEKTSLRLICPEPALLEDKLAAGHPISIHAVPGATGDVQDETLHRQRTGQVISEEYARDAIKKDQVLVNLPEADLTKRAVDIYRKTQTDLQEGGANTLYLALGFLLWKRNEKDDRRFRAPLILMPVSMERKSVRSGVKIVASDDESRFNTTLLEMLRKDFNLDITGLDGQLPTDDSGIDVTRVWNKIRQAVKEVPGFEVVEDVVLGNFSFSKYLMWKDLVDRTDQLRGNPVVAHLIDNPKAPYPSNVPFVNAKELDDLYTPADLFLPMPADSSQIAAVAAADRGKDFVIFGPPGTGKSQTITNMITHLLAKGKTVLFVSEKTAALEVVYRRLRDIGLNAFCLELHSSKASKSAVLNQLRNALSSPEETTDISWEAQAKTLETLRNRLNLVVARLHRSYPNGLTLYQAMGLKIKDEALITDITLHWPRVDQHDRPALDAMRAAVDKLAINARAIGNLSSSPFQVISTPDWSPQWEADLMSRASRLSLAAKNTDAACETLCRALGITLPDRTLERLEHLSVLAGLLRKSYKTQSAFALEPDGSERIEALEEAVTHLKAYAKFQAALSCPYEPEAWRRLDGTAIIRRSQEIAQMWFAKRWFAQRAQIKELKLGGALGMPSPAVDGPVLARLRQEGLAIDALDGTLSSLRIWHKHQTEPAQVEDLHWLGQHMRNASGRLADDIQSMAAIRLAIRNIIYEGNELLAPEATIGRASESYINSLESFKQALAQFEHLAGPEMREAHAAAAQLPALITEITEKIVSHQKELNAWCAWCRARNEALGLDLKPIVDTLENDLATPANVLNVFEAAYCDWWSRAVITEDEVLRAFSTPEHIATIEKFREMDTEFQTVTTQYVRAKLRAALPSQQDTSRTSEWGILQRELQKQRQHKPVRQLMQEIPTVLKTLAPCMMMSPLSIAQYLPASQSLFDVVIFDEASQITVWDAVGAIARGRQVIIAGDPKQMPPSNRFARSDAGEDLESQQDADLESILDEMLGASIPNHSLTWHYRSRRESLIAFSNYRYYDGQLITFPAPAVKDKGVHLVKVDGTYARGAGRFNEKEAKAIVSECVRRLTHADPDVRKQSIGVVTFNMEQQTLIENLLDAERSKNPGIEWAFAKDNFEPLFVKNLDTVQGDERDVILFSITFGPDLNGHVTMNFGDLNRKGGERRLNVAITRARSEMVVFSSLPADRIDLSRTSMPAVADLKHFLEFADRGTLPVKVVVDELQSDSKSPFEAAVAHELRLLGWQVSQQVGVSSYRIDLAVVHPDKPGEYLAGIECDGASYHGAATARDRDKVRGAVLEQLGWKLLRIWSTDWWTNKPKAIVSIHEILKALLEANKR